MLNQGVKILRGGAFKPRTSPYDFQGLGELGLRFMQSAQKQIIWSVFLKLWIQKILILLAKYVDILQIGARNMQNFSLLKAVGRTEKTYFTKTRLNATYNDFLMAAEYILANGKYTM